MKNDFEKLEVGFVGKDILLMEEIFERLSSLGIKKLYPFLDVNEGVDFNSEEDYKTPFFEITDFRISTLDYLLFSPKARNESIALAKGVENGPKIILLPKRDFMSNDLLFRDLIKVNDPEVTIMKELLLTFSRYEPKTLYWSLFEPASSRGKEGLEAFYNQVIDILNAKKIKDEIYAFRLYPTNPKSEGSVEKEVRLFSNYDGFLLRNTISVPLFHGFYISFFIELKNELLNKKEILTSLKQKGFFKFFDNSQQVTKNPLNTKPSISISYYDKNHIWGFVGFDFFEMVFFEVLNLLNESIKRK